MSERIPPPTVASFRFEGIVSGLIFESNETPLPSPALATSSAKAKPTSPNLVSAPDAFSLSLTKSLVPSKLSAKVLIGPGLYLIAP